MNYSDDSSSQDSENLPETDAPVEAEVVVAKPAGNRGYAKIAWGAILAVAATMIGLNMFVKGGGEGEDPVGGAGAAGNLNDSIVEFQGKLFVGWQAFNDSLGAPSEVAEKQRADIYRQIQTLDVRSVVSRIRFVVLAGEMAGPEEAKRKLEAFHDIDAGPAAPPSPEEQALLAAMSKLYADYADGNWEAPSLSASERKLIVNLGWFGELALAPVQGPNATVRSAVIGPAKFAFASTAIVAVAALFAFAAGTTGAFIFLVLVASRRVGPALETPSGSGGVYAETFALWMLIFIASSVIVDFAFNFVGSEPPLVLGVFSFLFGLVALAWPVLRGITWNQVRRDIGWTVGRSPLLEPIYGVVGYVCSLPLMAIGVAIVGFLVQIANSIRGDGEPSSTPTHPVADWITQGDWGQVAIIFVLACVCAPIIEETFFRGVLYRHLRDATWRWRVGLSVLFSSLANGILFAAIHPQGLLAVPALAAIALGLSLQREWRGSLIAPMVSHGLNNAVMLGLLLLITS
jgi:membrane protease YdiL (CAAX protease family)